jgi:hypothetical protein
MLSLTIAESVAKWRAKAAEGTLTREEMVAAIIAIRQERALALPVEKATKAAKAPKSAKTPSAFSGMSAEELFDQLGKL